MDDNNKDDKKVIYIPVPGGYETVELADIVFCEGAGSQSHMHLDGKEVTLTVCYGLKKLEEKLPPNRFLRIHDSYIINLYRIKKYFRLKDPELLMSNNKIVTVSRTKKSILLEKINETVLFITVLLNSVNLLPDDFLNWDQWMEMAGKLALIV